MPDDTLNLAQILWDERCALNGEALPSAAVPTDYRSIPQITRRPRAFTELGEDDLPEIYRALLANKRHALCLSGGGIRSAAFALGAIECLASYAAAAPDRSPGGDYAAQPPDDAAQVPLLQQFDYLSTVSGGGYLGSWLSAWLLRIRQAEPAGTGKADRVIAALAAPPNAGDAIEPVSNLRRDTHYLEPKFSALSPDLWSGIAAVVRNVLLNWLVVLPPLVFLVLFTKFTRWSLYTVHHNDWISSGFAKTLWLATAAMFLFALAFTAANRPTRRIANCSQARFFCCDFGAFLLGAIFLATVLPSYAGFTQAYAFVAWVIVWLNSLIPGGLSVGPLYQQYIAGAVTGAALYSVAWIAAYLGKPSRIGRILVWRSLRWLLADLAGWTVAGAIFGALIVAGCELWLAHVASHDHSMTRFLIFSIPAILLARLIADAALAGFTEVIPWSDGNLEWAARAGGVYALFLIGWLVWFALILAGGQAVVLAGPGMLKAVFGVTTVSGVGAALLGKSVWTKTIGDIQEARNFLGLNGLTLVGAALFAAGLIITVASLLDNMLEAQIFMVLPGYNVKQSAAAVLAAGTQQWSIGLLPLALLLVTVAASFLINVNRFSLHGVYRNRLTRAFLGASRLAADRERTRNRFTDFDSADTPLIADLWAHNRVPQGADWQPLHVVNVTVNLVSSKNLAWQERMAAPFMFSPLHAGSGSSAFTSAGSFRRSYPMPNDRWPYGGRYGLTLGTAMAISGAAVSPSMGYQTSAGVAFLMTMFNVRLGCWLGNPQPYSWSYAYTGPLFALTPLVREMFGLTTEKQPWIYLSDGGHFENLGLYEMVRRRCRLIVVCDAACDPDYAFADLGNALRKIWLDLGIRIDMVGLDNLKKRFKERPTPATEAAYWATGRIRYPEAEGDEEEGRLLYIKAGIHGTEPMDVLSYALEHADFPHQTTANQFFTESQFESYRALGYVALFKALATASQAHARAEEVAPALPENGQPRTLDSYLENPLPMTLPRIIELLETALLDHPAAEPAAD
jgi:hypothetical protein